MLKKILSEAVRLDASDVHLTAGQPPFFRVAGDLFQSGGVLTARELENFLSELLTPRLRDELEKNLSVDFSYVAENISRRFRVNVYYQRKMPALALRLIAKEIPTLDALGAPPAMKKFFDAAQGLILVTGRTGSGKSTTLAAFLNELCQLRPCHLLTLEDPIEFEYAAEKSFISQRELGQDFLNFADAVRTAMREMPDVLLIGEIRDVAHAFGGGNCHARRNDVSARSARRDTRPFCRRIQRDNLSTARQNVKRAAVRGGSFNRKSGGAFADSAGQIRSIAQRHDERAGARYANNGNSIKAVRSWSAVRLSRKGKFRIKVLEKRIADGDLEAMMEYAQRYQCDCPEEVTPEIAQKLALTRAMWYNKGTFL